MSIQTPMKAIQGNLLLNHLDEVWAYYRINALSTMEFNEKLVQGQKTKMDRFLEEMNEYKHIHLWEYPQDAQLGRRFQDLESDFSKEVFQSANYYSDETVHILSERLETPTKYDFILGVKLSGRSFSAERSLQENIRTIARGVNAKLLNVLNFERLVYDDVFYSFKEQEEMLLGTVLSMEGERLTQQEMMYINRFSFIRGMKHETDVVDKEATVSDITNTVIDPTPYKALRLVAPEGESYVTFLTVDDMGDNMAGAHLFYDAQKLPFPIEVSLKASLESKGMTKSNLGFKETQVEEKIEEQAHSSTYVDSDVVEAGEMMQVLKESLKVEDLYLWNWLATLIVTGKTAKESMERARITQRFFKSMGVRCKIPIADQLNLFYRNLMGQDLELLNKDWQQKSLRDGLAELLFATKAEVGNKVGFHIGWIDREIRNIDKATAVANSRDFVLYHPMLGNQQIARTKTKSPHTLVSGDTGEGKTYLATMIYMYVLMLDIKSLAIDPKKEKRKHIEPMRESKQLAEEYPLFIEMLNQIQFVTLDANIETNYGVLDPIQLFEDDRNAKEMVEVIINQVYTFEGEQRDVVELAFLDAIRAVLNRKALGEQVGTLHVIELMQHHELAAVQNAGNLLYRKVEDSILKLLIHDGSNPALSLNHQHTILEVENLDLPNSDIDIRDYSKSQLASSAVMFALGRFCELFGSDPSERTLESIDEAWIFNTTQQGRKVKESMRRVGRSQENAMLFITQKVSDEDTSNFGTAFAFKESEKIEEILDWMKMKDTEVNREMVENMFQGQCIFRDVYGRVAKISIDCLFDEWQDAMKTVNKTKVAEAEERYL